MKSMTCKPLAFFNIDSINLFFFLFPEKKKYEPMLSIFVVNMCFGTFVILNGMEMSKDL